MELNITNELNKIAEMADTSFDNKDIIGLENSLSLINNLPKELLKDNEEYYHYILSNIFSYLAKVDRNKPEYIEKELFHTRKALYSDNILKVKKSNPSLYLSICTNYANTLSQIGRTLEAIEIWKNCLNFNSSFSMANLNLAIGLFTYAYALYDEGHKNIFLARAKELFENSINQEITFEARSSIENYIIRLKNINSKKILQVLNKNFSLGKSKDEVAYRKWALNNNLFINPLNDLCDLSIACKDIFHLPDMIETDGKLTKQSYYGFYNIIKYEYVIARYTYYETILNIENKFHFADRDVLLYDSSFDYPLTNIYIEKIKYCYRALFSIFDKIAYFLNSYLNLKINENNINFKNLWYNEGEYKKGTSKILSKNNLFLNGLFWLNKDINSKVNDIGFITDEDTLKIKAIRNSLEHKYLKIHNNIWYEYDNTFKDALCCSIKINEFSRICFKLLKLVKYAIIYLSLIVKIEEDKILNTISNKTLPMPLFTIKN